MDKIVICFECGAKNEYVMKKNIRKFEGEDYAFQLQVEEPFCKQCGAPIVIEEIEEEIAQRANEKIRESRGIISRDEIEAILKLYGVSQKYLSKLLGWGEITLTRYVSGGYTPSKENSKKLKQLNNPYIFQSLLNKRVDADSEALKEAAYRKAQDKVDLQLQQIEEQRGNLYKVVDWFMAQSTEEDPITHLALQKMLYFVQCWSKVLLGEWMFSQDCEAWAHGAVYRDVYNDFKYFRYMPLPRLVKKVEIEVQLLDFLNAIKACYYDVYSARMLEKICHKEEPYINVWSEFSDNNNCSEKIPKARMEDYYKRIATKYEITLKDMSGIRKYLFELTTR